MMAPDTASCARAKRLTRARPTAKPAPTPGRAGRRCWPRANKAVGKVYAGTSGWAYATWKPDFYPAKLASAKFLGHYASRLNTVEVNYTFRRFPTEKLLRG